MGTPDKRTGPDPASMTATQIMAEDARRSAESKDLLCRLADEIARLDRHDMTASFAKAVKLARDAQGKGYRIYR